MTCLIIIIHYCNSVQKWVGFTMANLEERLTTEDLRIVRSEIFRAARKWYDIGVELRMSPDKLDSIKEMCSNNPEDCLRELLKTWLDGDDPNTNWKSIVAALRSPAVGHYYLSNKIRLKYSNAAAVVHNSSEHNGRNSTSESKMDSITPMSKVNKDLDHNLELHELNPRAASESRCTSTSKSLQKVHVKFLTSSVL